MAIKEVKRIEPHTTRTGVSLADLLGKSREVAVPFPNGLTLEVVYDPTKVTSHLVEINLEDPDRHLMAKAVCKVVKSWDLSDCQDVGPGHEDAVARTVPVEVLGLVIKAITEDNSLNPRQARPTTA